MQALPVYAVLTYIVLVYRISASSDVINIKHVTASLRRPVDDYKY